MPDWKHHFKIHFSGIFPGAGKSSRDFQVFPGFPGVLAYLIKTGQKFLEKIYNALGPIFNSNPIALHNQDGVTTMSGHYLYAKKKADNFFRT